MNAAENKDEKDTVYCIHRGKNRCNKYNKKWLSWKGASANTERFSEKSKIFWRRA